MSRVLLPVSVASLDFLSVWTDDSVLLDGDVTKKIFIVTAWWISKLYSLANRRFSPLLQSNVFHSSLSALEAFEDTLSVQMTVASSLSFIFHERMFHAVTVWINGAINSSKDNHAWTDAADSRNDLIYKTNSNRAAQTVYKQQSY